MVARGNNWAGPCEKCGQYVMLHELRNQGKGCIYCLVGPPTPPRDPVKMVDEMMETEHKMALEEERLRKRRKRSE